MSEWIPIERWRECREMSRPDIVFELRNAHGQTLLTRCDVQVPPAPFDWSSPAVTFRAVSEPAPRRSTPLPPPGGR